MGELTSPVMVPLLGALFSFVVTAYCTWRVAEGQRDVETSEAQDLWNTLRGEVARLQIDSVDRRAPAVEAVKPMRCANCGAPRGSTRRSCDYCGALRP